MTEKPAPDAEPEFMGTSWEEDVPETHLDVVEEIAEALADMRRHVYPTPDKPDSSYAKWERANKALSALRTHDDTLEDAAKIVLGLVVRGREPTRQEFAQAIRNMKAMSRRLAESGATSLEGRAITGHKTDKEFAHYAEQANKRALGRTAMGKMLANHSGKPIAAILQEYAIVPKEPTEAMCDNGGKVLLGDANAQTLYTSTAQKCYRAMIAAAPKLESE